MQSDRLLPVKLLTDLKGEMERFMDGSIDLIYFSFHTLIFFYHTLVEVPNMPPPWPPMTYKSMPLVITYI